jgi:energy-coupling factor transport system substrate-specific component
MDNLKRSFSTVTLVLIPVAIAINIAVGQLIVTTKVPLYLDSIGTVLVGLLAGPWAGLVTGLLANIIWGVSGLSTFATPFAIVAGIIGMLAGVFGGLKWFKRVWLWLIGGVITGVVAAIVSAPISAYLFGGVTGTGQDFLVAFFRATGASVMQATFGQGITADPLDKLASFLIVYLIVKALPKRFLQRFPRAENVTD